MWDAFKTNLTGALGTARSYLPTWGRKVSGDCTAADGKLAIIEKKIKSIQEEVAASALAFACFIIFLAAATSS
jgi:hypothetical protein